MPPTVSNQHVTLTTVVTNFFSFSTCPRTPVVSDGHGFTHPHGIAGTGVTGAGAGQYFFARGTPAPVTRVCGFVRRSF